MRDKRKELLPSKTKQSRRGKLSFFENLSRYRSDIAAKVLSGKKGILRGTYEKQVPYFAFAIEKMQDKLYVSDVIISLIEKFDLPKYSAQRIAIEVFKNQHYDFLYLILEREHKIFAETGETTARCKILSLMKSVAEKINKASSFQKSKKPTKMNLTLISSQKESLKTAQTIFANDTIFSKKIENILRENMVSENDLREISSQIEKLGLSKDDANKLLKQLSLV